MQFSLKETKKDFAIFQETGIVCLVNKQDIPSDTRSEEPLEMKRCFTVLGLIVVRTVKVNACTL